MSAQSEHPLTEAERSALHAPHSTPINRDHHGCPLCFDYQVLVERIVAAHRAEAEAERANRAMAVAQADRHEAETYFAILRSTADSEHKARVQAEAERDALAATVKRVETLAGKWEADRLNTVIDKESAAYLIRDALEGDAQ